MKTYFRRKTCSECRCAYDSIGEKCPKCGHPNPEFERGYPFEHHLRDTFPWQIGYLLLGYLGFQALGLFISLIFQTVYTSSHPGATAAEISSYMSQVNVSFAVTGGAYAILFAAFVLILSLRRKIPALVKSFAHWIPYVVGIGGGIALLGISIAYSFLAEAICKAANVTPSPNENESAIRLMTQAFPALSIIVFGLIGPFCEEMGYRVGLFGLTSRLGKVAAYVISAFVFGAIHFGWDILGGGNRDAIIIEIVNFPSYLIAGFGLCFIYDRCGFAASFLAHATNNLVSVIVQLLPGGAN